MRTHKKKKLLLLLLVAPPAFLLFIALGWVVVQQLWNWLLPAIFGWHAVTFWQALGLLALCRILFGGFGFHRAGGSGVRRRMAEQWEHMTPEEQERLREKMRERWGFVPPTREHPGTPEGAPHA